MGDPPGCACVSEVWRSAGSRGRLKCTGLEPVLYAKDENVDQRLREAQPRDLPFLREMLHEAVFWRAGADMPSLTEGLAYPEVERSLENWGKRVGDTGVVATVD
mgnify:CR=1 FL=1